MTIIVSPQGDILGLDDHLDRLKRLVADLEALKLGRHPDPASIEGSAGIRGWVLDTRPAPCLRGHIVGHPDIRDGRMGVTSDLWVWAPDHGYARTLSRWYALGPRDADADRRGRQ
ncbi:hypothetical protein [Aureimonas leprariae]|uniref:Uncharacterized protein n=1 Tax=Plantimonas leprariae TaxID=2615207 RepID=A0A7V7PN64_9HYPH|nr:hypothetical protein [Aureimonas leprariae]KAB0679061.1 hypothetical protein F6X38_14295 [Aureimonas leprariae]